jgi:hypothetical protein
MVYDPEPVAYKAVRVWLSDGSRMLACGRGSNGGVLKEKSSPSGGSLKNEKEEDPQTPQGRPKG